MRPVLLALLALALPALAQDDPRLAFVAGRANLAAGRPVELVPEPDYRLTREGGTDAVDLTDGVISDHPRNQIWFDDKAVGWSFASFMRLKVDLGEVRPIDEMALHLQGGAAQGGIALPEQIVVLVSDDGEAWQRVAAFEKTAEQQQAQGLPAEEGTAWVAPVRLTDLNTRGRWVGVEIRAGGGLTLADELFVFAGDHNPAAVSFMADAAEPFATQGAIVHFQKPVYTFSTNVATYGSIGLIDARAEEQQGKPLRLRIDTPAGVTVEAGSFRGTAVYSPRSAVRPPDDHEPPQRESLPGGGERLHLTADGGTEKSWARIFVTGDVPPGPAGVLRIAAEWDGGRSEAVQPLEAIEIPAAPQPTELMTNMGWVGIELARLWPDFLTAYRHLGFNQVPIFTRWHNPAESADVYAFLDECRDAGFTILNMESPIHPMLSAQRNNPEIHHQLPDGKESSQFCPSYRGEHYQAAIASAVERWAPSKAEVTFFDIEWWNWRGPTEAEQCSRCQARKAELGVEAWDEFLKVLGREMMEDLVGAYRAKAGEIGLDPAALRFGGYDFQAGRVYQNVWDFDRLYPDLIQFAQPSWYTPLLPTNLKHIREETLDNRAHLPANDIVPWLTPGDSGEFDSRKLTWALAETLVSGARGFTWWSGRTWDAGDFAAVARVLRWLAPHEAILLRGEPRGALATTGPGSAVAEVLGNEALVLVSAYGTSGEATTSVTLPDGIGGTVTDLAGDGPIGTVDAGGEVEVRFGEDRCRVFHVAP